MMYISPDQLRLCETISITINGKTYINFGGFHIPFHPNETETGLIELALYALQKELDHQKYNKDIDERLLNIQLNKQPTIFKGRRRNGSKTSLQIEEG